LVPGIRPRLDDWPTAVVKIDGLSVLHVPDVKPPLISWKVVQLGQFPDHSLRWRGEDFESLRALLRHRISLRLRCGRQKHDYRAEECDREKPLRGKGTVVTTKKCGEHANGLPKNFCRQK
jgi:hypothetical protein